MSKSNEASEDIKSAIENRARQLEDHFANRDANSLVNDYYVPEEMEPLASGGDKAIIGRAGLAEMFAGLFETYEAVRQVPLTIRADKNLAYEVSNAYMKPRNGGAEEEFRYIATWRLCDDGWRVEADFFATGQV